MSQAPRQTSTAKRPAAPAPQRAAAEAAGRQSQAAPPPAVVRPRLAWNPALETAYAEMNVSAKTWRTLVETIWPEAKTVEAVGMALAYCQARKLDPFKRPVHIVPVWNSSLGKQVETVWPGISELRTTAMRTGEYAGKDEVRFGPEITDTVGKTALTFPEWAQVTVYRIVKGHRVAFAGDPVYWRESYAQRGGKDKDTSPNAMWSKRTRGQLAKVAEAMALRQAFPEELGGAYSAEEMHGQTIDGEVIEGSYARSGEPRQRRTLDLETGDVIDQSPPPHDPVEDPPAPEEPSQEAEFEEGGQAEEQFAQDGEIIEAAEQAISNAAPVDRHLDLAEHIDNLREIAGDDRAATKHRDRAAELVAIHDDDKAKADAIAAKKKATRT